MKDRSILPARGIRLRWLTPLMVAASCLPITVAAEASRYERIPTRSIYVPVRFTSCTHLENVRLSVEGFYAEFSLGRRVFQFTYYPNRKAIFPALVEVKVKADGIGGRRRRLDQLGHCAPADFLLD